MKLKTAAVIMLISALAFAACDDSDSNSPAQSTDQLSAVITPDGGTISSEDGSWEIEFSAGAVSEPTTIAITTWPVGTKTVPEGYEGIFKVLEFNPHGIEFHSAVTLRIFYEQGDMPDDGIEERMLGFYYVNDEGALEEAVSTVDTSGNCLEVQLPHFSFGMPLRIAIRLVNAGILTNEVIVGIIADKVADELNSMTPEERDAFIEDNIGILGPFAVAVDDILDENPVAGLISADMVFYRDADLDGYGDPDEPAYALTAPAGYVDNDLDCDDTQADIHPGSAEISGDGVDNNCDGTVDEKEFYHDADNDGSGNPDVSVIADSAPAGYVDNNDDCDDTRADIYPGRTEISGDGVDNNCDGMIDEREFYQDADGDGYGTSHDTVIAETAPAGYVDNNDDCDDSRADIHPGSTEIPDDSLDNDCDGVFDEGYFYRDADSDGYGDPNDSIYAASAPPTYVDNNDDCNDTRADIYPGRLEISGDGLDNNCDGIQGVTLVSAAQGGGAPGTSDSTRITLTFDAYPTGLAAGNITVNGATRGTLTGTGNTRTLAISNITVADGEEVTVTMANPSGYSIAGSPMNVLVYRNNFTLATAPGQQVTIRAGDVEFNMIYANSAGNIIIPAGADDTGTASLTRRFFMGETEVTWELWKEVYDWAVDPARGVNQYSFENPGRMGSAEDGSDMTGQHPVTMITWRDAVIWCNALSEMTGAGAAYLANGTIGGLVACQILRSSLNDSYSYGANVEEVLELWGSNLNHKGFRLASSEEWEYAARYIGTTAPTVQDLAADCLYYNKGGQFTSLTSGYYWTPADYASGATSDYEDETGTRAVAWYSYDPGMGDADRSMPVGYKTANQLGIYDMSGNVWEWCFTTSESDQMRRGGSWSSTYVNMSVGAGALSAPDYYDGDISFRLAKTQ